METWNWIEVVVWWLIALDAAAYNLIAWSNKGWYEAKFSKFSRIFPVTKAFGLLYALLAAWLGFALSRASVPVFGP